MGDAAFVQEAIDLARENVGRGGRPFGAVLIRDGEVIVRAGNWLEADHDPTAHAELIAPGDAGQPELDRLWAARSAKTA
ncbi:MAG TPA: hypothetical protein PKA33_18590 [Amaricoccus sp.]|uniref:hypothetical protein n=1 Tax=Amaricoccus sp. TaxID=1872485 RepID=UPI002C8A414F|nr:hypothetical protein [Amaricoccus sp.]HMQ93815.1 hypothetical protein [Amaricoccus sp.]HMR53804.1 hypothetical protein [Amaricoccus sp.]HMU01354.1 hypothetical protein [Amaricoccus sp.]